MWTVRLPTGHEHIVVRGQKLVIGRQGCDLAMEDKSVSRRHAACYLDGEGLVLEDLGSRFGTCVNGSLVTTATALQPADSIVCGAAGQEALRHGLVFGLALEPDVRIPLENCGCRVVPEAAPEATHLLTASVVEPSLAVLGALARGLPLVRWDYVESFLREKQFKGLHDSSPAHIRGLAGLVPFSPALDRSALLRGLHFIPQDPSLAAVLGRFSATASAQLQPGKDNFALGHILPDCPSLTLSELVVCVATGDFSCLDGARREFEGLSRLSGAAADSPLEPIPADTAPPAGLGTKVVVAYAALRRPDGRAPLPDPKGSAGAVNSKRFKKSFVVRRGLGCIGLADMLAYRPTMETGTNGSRQEEWLAAGNLAASTGKRLHDGFGDVRVAKTTRLAYEPVINGSGAFPRPAEATPQGVPTPKGPFRSSFFSAIS